MLTILYYLERVDTAQRQGRRIVKIHSSPTIDKINVNVVLIRLDFPNNAVMVDIIKHKVLMGPRMQKNRTLISP